MLGFGRALTKQIEKYGLIGVFMVMMLFFWFFTESAGRFGTSANLKVVIVNAMVRGALGLAFIVPLLAGQFDLSVGYNLAFSGVMTAVAFERWGWPLWIAILVGVGCSTLVGVVNGLLVVKGGINALIVTLGMATFVDGLVRRMSDGQVVSIKNPKNDNWLVAQRDFPRPAFFVIIVAVVLWYVLEHTPWGRKLHAVGANPAAARLVGINVKKMVFSSFVLCGFIAGITGILQVARDSGGNPSNGPGYLLPVFAAAFLGSTVIKQTFNVRGTLVGLLFVVFAVNGLQLAGAKPYVEQIFNGLALLVAVLITAYIGRLRGKRMFM
jgi:ribose transport system permease protein